MAPREIPTILVKMDISTGYSISTEVHDIIPFVAIPSSDKYGTHYTRWQLPLEPAFACTTHKMQGSTAKHGAVIQPSIGKPFSRGLDYVAPSRPTELNNLFLLRRLSEENFNGFKTEITDISNEYNRLRQINK